MLTMLSLVVALAEELDEERLSLSLMVAFKCLPNGFASKLIKGMREYLFENLEEYRGPKHSERRAEALRKKGYRIYEVNLDEEDDNWVVSLLYQMRPKLKTSRMQMWTYRLGDKE
jgi:hypothetical protein